MDRVELEQTKQASNIWAMITAACFVAIFIQGYFFLGLFFGSISLHMCFRLTKRWVEAEEVNKKWKK